MSDNNSRICLSLFENSVAYVYIADGESIHRGERYRITRICK